MKYIDAEKLRAEIERLKAHETRAKAIKEVVYLKILSFLDTHEEPVSEDLEEAADDHIRKVAAWHPGWDWKTQDIADAFKAGAEWQKKQDEKTIELAEEHAYFAGGVNEREKMMEGAVEGYVTYGSKGAYVESDWLGTYDVEVFGPNGSKVKIIIVKEDEK